MREDIRKMAYLITSTLEREIMDNKIAIQLHPFFLFFVPFLCVNRVRIARSLSVFLGFYFTFFLTHLPQTFLCIRRNLETCWINCYI